MNLITVFTPTYNRAYILEKLYNSLQNQKMHEFEWVIIDDGSTDDTEQKVSHWIDENNFFDIRYFKQENGGKCRAINRALDLARGKLFLVIDSDDYLTGDALEKIAEWEGHLPENTLYCGVSGNLGTSENTTSNHLFENRSYDGNLLDRYKNVDGERAFAFFTEIHRKYKYPVFQDEKFMTEAVVYNRMANDGYMMRFFNDIICIYEYQEDGLTKAGNKLFLQNPKGYALWMKEKTDFLEGNWKNKLRLWYSYYCEMSNCESAYRLTKNQCAEYIGAPLCAMHAVAVLHKIRSFLKELI